MNTEKINVRELQTHEEVEKSKLQSVIKSIKSEGLKDPIKVSREEKIVLDGHHRLESFKILGLREIPVIKVDYFSDKVEVESRKRFEVNKEDVVEVGNSDYNFPAKTTRHIFREKLTNL